MDLLGQVPPADMADVQDKQLLPRAMATFARWLREQKSDAQRQGTRDAYVLAVFKLFSQTGRSLNAVAQPRLLEAVTKSEEARKNKLLSTAVRNFQRFWAEIGGYSGAFDEADRDTMNLALSVKPSLTDGSAECCTPMPGGRYCKRPDQQCITCGTRLKCSLHCEHSVQECREIFWSKHSRLGSRQRTVLDFWKPSASSSQDDA